MKSVCRHRNAGVCSTSTTRGDVGDLVYRVHVGQHRHADLALHFGEDAQALVHARAAKRLRRAAIGLVVGRLEDERDAERRADFLQLPGDVDLQLLAIRRRTARRSGTAAGRGRRRNRRASWRPAQPSASSLPHQDDGTASRTSARVARRCRSSAARDEADEQRMAAPRVRGEFRVELAAEEPRVLRQLDHFAQVARHRALGPRADDQAGGLEPRQIMVVDFVAVAVALGDRRCAVDALRQRCRARPRRAARPGASCRPGRTARSRFSIVPSRFCHSVISATTGCGVSRIELGAVGVRRGPPRVRAYSITASCMPRQMPRYGMPFSRA